MSQKSIIFTLLATLLLALLVGCGNLAEPSRAILYLWEDDANQVQLFQLADYNDPTSAEQLTAFPFGVFEYAVAPDGHAVLLSVNREDGGGDLWLLPFNKQRQAQAFEHLLSCPNLICEDPVWSHDNRRAVYVERQLNQTEPRLWWVDTQSADGSGAADTVPVFTDSTIHGYFPQLSAKSTYLSFVRVPIAVPRLVQDEDGQLTETDSPTEPQHVVVYNLTTGKQLIVPNLHNSDTWWHPLAAQEHLLLINDMFFFGERFGIHLLRLDARDGSTVDLSDGLTTEDASPAWSPDGSQIVFGRKETNTANGRQLMLADAESRDISMLTNTPDLHHGPPHFSADGTQLLLQQFDLRTANAQPRIILYSFADGTIQEIVQMGYQPAWLP